MTEQSNEASDLPAEEFASEDELELEEPEGASPAENPYSDKEFGGVQEDFDE